MSVKVAVRVRPFNQRQKFLGCLNCIQMKDRTTMLINPRDRSQKEHQFTFDYSFWSHDGYEELENGYLYPIDDRFIDQKKVFKQLGQDILKNAWNGYNICLFAYGQTGAGKSYSMIGYEANRGIVPMACEKIFENIAIHQVMGKKQFQITLSMLEIYNEKVQDLFVHTSKRPVNGLKIRQSKKTGVYVEGITRFRVNNYAQIERRMQEGAKNRSLASTLMNEYSSRAHTIVMIEFVQKQFITDQKINKKSSVLNLVDLAGSERIAKTGISDRDRLKQASQINKSLHTLGRVIQHLAQVSAGKQNVQIPYRDSVLTRILETALGGNSVTTMICAISPANDNYEQTLSTLRYADQTKKIKNKPIINESAVDKIIRELRQENQRLKEMLRIAKLKGLNLQEEDGNIFSNMAEIQRQIRTTMKSFAINTNDVEEESDQSMTISQFVDLPDPNDFYSGVLDLDSSTTTIGSKANAYITNLSQDRLLSFKIKYSCEQELYVGTKNLKDGPKNKLILCGLGVEDRHAKIFQQNNRFFIEPLSEQANEYTLVNGKQIQGRTELFQNDRLIFGTNSVFLFKNLSQSPKVKPRQSITKRLSISVDTDGDLDESLLLDSEQPIQPKHPASNSSSSDKLQLSRVQSNSALDQKLLDYEFAINERQNKMFQNSYGHSLGQSQVQIQAMAMDMGKLQQIEKQFELLKKENERKVKEKEEQFRQELRKLEIQKEIQKAKLKEELKNKENQAKKIKDQKQRIQKIRDKLIEIQRERKEKLKNRESMLLGDDMGSEGFIQNFQQIQNPNKNANYSKKNTLSIGQSVTIQKPEPIIETRIEYIDRHHFHYDFNLIQDGRGTLPNEDYKGQERSMNTTSSNITNLNVNHDESMLLDYEEMPKNLITDSNNLNNDNSQKRLNNDGGENREESEKKIGKSNKNLTFQNVYNMSETPNIKEEEYKSNALNSSSQYQQQRKQRERKQSLNLTDILLDSYPIRKQSKKSDKSIQDENLLSITHIQHPEEVVLQNYLPSAEEIKILNDKKSDSDVSLTLSDDLTQHYMIREEELMEKIREYEQKLKSLEQSEQQKKQSIKNIRKSFALDFGENPNSQNFFSDKNLFENGELDLSLIEKRHGSGQIVQQTQFQKKIKRNMIQCKNENIINQRTLQVRKRRREAEELKEAFIKRQRKQLQKQLIQLIPMLQKFNLWAKQMNRAIEGRIQIEYHNFTNYEIIDVLKSSTQGRISIAIRIYNYEECRCYKWLSQVFKNRFEIAESVFERYLQNQNGDIFQDKSRDPFWDPPEFISFAVGYLSLEALSYSLEYEGDIALVWKGKIVGYLEVLLEPVSNKKKIKEGSQIEELIYDPRQLLDEELVFTISFQNFRPTEHLQTNKIQKYFLSYEILSEGYKRQTYRTQEIAITKKKIGYTYKHSFSHITQQTLAYLADAPLCVTLNLLFECDEEMNGLNSSSMHYTESSLNLSSISQKNIKQQSVLPESPPPFSKKKPTIILENPDILAKIEENYSTQQIKKKQRAAELSSSTKKKDKKQECAIF